jgi:hypothetical protein
MLSALRTPLLSLILVGLACTAAFVCPSPALGDETPVDEASPAAETDSSPQPSNEAPSSDDNSADESAPTASPTTNEENDDNSSDNDNKDDSEATDEEALGEELDPKVIERNEILAKIDERYTPRESVVVEDETPVASPQLFLPLSVIMGVSFASLLAVIWLVLRPQ